MTDLNLRGGPYLLVEAPPGFGPERRYILDTVLTEFLDLNWQLATRPGRQVRITCPVLDEGELVLPDTLFATSPDAWLTEASLPTLPLARWTPSGPPFWTADPLPVLYGQADLTAFREEGAGARRIEVPLDIFGSAFFMLTRYEERVRPERDRHGRFPAAAAIATREGFLERAIVNEYIEVLWAALRHLWPILNSRRRRHVYRPILSHDVDWPRGPEQAHPLRAATTSLADVLRRRDPELAWRRLAAAVAPARAAADPHDTFDFIMDLGERFGLVSAFNFIPENEVRGLDGTYALTDPWIRSLMQRIHARGHAIGCHPSYKSLEEPGRTAREFALLRETATKLGIEQSRWGGRQHFLRWANPTTWRAWEDAGLDDDGTLGYPESPGFRAGICWDYPVFDLDRREHLRLREHPLIAMETTLLGHLRLAADDAYERIARLDGICRRHGGQFTLLWHNSGLQSRAEKRLYHDVLELLASPLRSYEVAPC